MGQSIFRKEKWNFGKIVEKYGPCNYKVLIGQHTTKWHVDKLCYRYFEFPDLPNAFDDFPSPPEEELKETLVRYPSRERRPLNQLAYYILISVGECSV